MPVTNNNAASARRKVRCPKCTALLTEPPTPIYECPICSTLLLAKGSSGIGLQSIRRNNGIRRDSDENPQESSGLGKTRLIENEGQQDVDSKYSASETRSPLDGGPQALDHRDTIQVTQGNNGSKFHDEYLSSGTASGDTSLHSVLSETSAHPIQKRPIGSGDSIHKSSDLSGTDSSSSSGGSEVYADSPPPCLANVGTVQCPDLSQAPMVTDGSTLSGNYETCIGPALSVHTERPLMVSGPVQYPEVVHDNQDNRIDHFIKKNVDYQIDCAECPESVQDNQIDPVECPEAVQDHVEKFYIDCQPDNRGSEDVGPATEIVAHSEELDVTTHTSSVNDTRIESSEWPSSDKKDETNLDSLYSCCINESTGAIRNHLDEQCPPSKVAETMSPTNLYDTDVTPMFPIESKCIYTDSRSNNETEFSAVPNIVGSSGNEMVQEGYNIFAVAVDFNPEVQDSKGDLYFAQMPEILDNSKTDSETTTRHLCIDEISNPVLIVEGDNMSAATNLSDTTLPIAIQQAKGNDLTGDDCYTVEQMGAPDSRETISLLDTSFCDWQSSKVVEACKRGATDLDSVHEKRVLTLGEDLVHYVHRDPIISASPADDSFKPKESRQRVDVSLKGFADTCEDQSSVLPFRTTVRQRVLQRDDSQTRVAGLSHQAAELDMYESPVLSDLSPHYFLPTTMVKNNQQNNIGDVNHNHKHALTSNVQYVDSASDSERKVALLQREEKDVVAIQSPFAAGEYENKLGQTFNRDGLLVQGITKQDTSFEMNVTARIYGQLNSRMLSPSSSQMQGDERRGHYKVGSGDCISNAPMDISAQTASYETNATARVYGQLDSRLHLPNRSLMKGDVRQEHYKEERADHTSQTLLDKHMKIDAHGLNDPENADSSDWQEQGLSQQGSIIDESYRFLGPADYHDDRASRRKETARFAYPNELYLASTSALSLPANKGHNAVQMPGINSVIPTLKEQTLAHYAHRHASPSLSYRPQSRIDEPEMHSKMLLHHCEVCHVHPSSMDSHRVFHEPYNRHMHSHVHASLPGRECQPFLPQQHEGFHQSSVSFKHPASSAWRAKAYPPLPHEGAAPFVLCRGCNLVLQVPTYLPPNAGPVQKLRCGSCRIATKFSLSHQKINLSYIQRSQAPDALAYRVSQFSTRPDLLPSNHGRRPLVANDFTGLTSYRPESRSQYDAVNNYTLRQKKATLINDSDVESVDYAYHPRLTACNMGGRGQYQSHMIYGDSESVFNHSLPFHEGYRMSSSGASLTRNASEDQSFEAAEREKAILGGRMRGSVGIAEHGKVYELGELPSFLNGQFYNSPTESGSKPPSGMQGSFQDYSINKKSFNEPLQRCQPSRQAMLDSDLSRSSSRSSASHLRRLPAAPGSPLIEHFSQASADLGWSLQQHRNVQNSVTGMRSVPWSPAPGSPLYDHLKYDAPSDIDERSDQRDPETEKVQGMSSQDASKGAKYYAGLLKKGIRDLSKGVQGNNNRQNPKVMINGHPIPDTVARKAEERAGTIYPGSYWYDYQAGFWGVMGGPCLGIIPPFIEEFNFALPEDCAGGTTRIFVNGRELHVKDLQVLYKRGLPITSGKAYIIDITGRVIDAASGQKLESLGKLAPSVERSGQGNGMFHPGMQP